MLQVYKNIVLCCRGLRAGGMRWQNAILYAFPFFLKTSIRALNNTNDARNIGLCYHI